MNPLKIFLLGRKTKIVSQQILKIKTFFTIRRTHNIFPPQYFCNFQVDTQLERLTECYLDIKERRLGKLHPAAPASIREREILKLDTFGKKQICRRAQFKGHKEGLPCWKECEKGLLQIHLCNILKQFTLVMVDTQHRATRSEFSKAEQDMIAYWIKECSKKVLFSVKFFSF